MNKVLPAKQVVGFLLAEMSGEVYLLFFSGRFERYYKLRTQRRSSTMEILNTVFSALNLLATVIIGVIQITWMISKDVFRDNPRAKHYSQDKK